MKDNLCIYHGDCNDGLASAAIVMEALGDEVEFEAGVHSQPMKSQTHIDQTVYMVDFSYSRDEIIAIASFCKQVIILDHHKTTEAELVDLPDNVTAIFDMNRSGAMLTWKFFNPGSYVNPLVFHVEDRDLWKFELPETKAITAALTSHSPDVATWHNLLFSKDPEEFVIEGRVLLRQYNQSIRQHVLHAATMMAVAGYAVPALNCPRAWSSDALHLLDTAAPFAMGYLETADLVEVSLRSNPDSPLWVDVSEIALRFGGGGHPNAAGFKLPLDGWKEFIAQA